MEVMVRIEKQSKRCLNADLVLSLGRTQYLIVLLCVGLELVLACFDRPRAYTRASSHTTRSTSQREISVHSVTDRLERKLCSIIGTNCSHAGALANKLGRLREPLDGDLSISETACPTVWAVALIWF